MFCSKSYPDFKKAIRELKKQDFSRINEHDLVGQDEIGEIISGMEQMGITVNRDSFSVRTDNHLLNYRLIEAGLGLGFILKTMTRKNKNMVNLLEDITIGNFPIWLTAHREIKTNPRMRLVYDELGKFLKDLS
jgi:hypothetical protein